MSVECRWQDICLQFVFIAPITLCTDRLVNLGIFHIFRDITTLVKNSRSRATRFFSFLKSISDQRTFGLFSRIVRIRPWWECSQTSCRSERTAIDFSALLHWSNFREEGCGILLDRNGNGFDRRTFVCHAEVWWKS